MSTAVLFSGVGTLSPESAQVRELAKPLPFYDDAVAYVKECYGIDVEDIWQRLSESGVASLNAVEEILIHILIQLTGFHLCRCDGSTVVTVGHSIGEFAAAIASKRLTLQEGLKAAIEVGKVTNSKKGSMYFGRIREDLQGVSIASVNFSKGPGSFGVLSMDAPDTTEKLGKKVFTNYPWHHKSYEALAKETFSNLKLSSSASSSALTLYTSLAATQKNPTLDAEYFSTWCYQGVDLSKTLSTLSEEHNVTRVLEIGAHPVLLDAVRAIFPASKVEHYALFSREIVGSLNKVTWLKFLKDEFNVEFEGELRKAFAPETLSLGRTWDEHGFTSFFLTQMSEKLAQQGIVPGMKPSDFFLYPTPQDLIQGLADVNDGEKNAKRVSTESVDSALNSVVVSAMSCLLGSNIKSPDQLFAFTSAQGDAVHFESLFDSGKQPAGYLSEISIDHAKFKLSRSQLNTIDPQQALVLNCVDKLLEEHGISQLPKETGVYIGAWNSEFQGDNSSVFYPTGTNQSLIAARVSHVYRLCGPCKVVNNACASSLEAILEGFRDIQQGRVEAAIVGGVNLLWDPQFTTCMAQSGFLGPKGRCRTFDQNADGYVRAEGCGLLLLTKKDLEKPYYCELLGGASNHNGGRTTGITAPSPGAQQEVVNKALQDAKLTAEQVDYIECHGTGTKIGDPIEVTALNKVVGRRSSETKCYLGCVKSNLGHLESAAGVAGFIHAAMVLRNETVPMLANLTKLNPALEGLVQSSALTVPLDGNVHVPSRLCVAGVSSFGFGGSNVHLVMKRGENQPRPRAPVARLSREDLFVFKRAPPAQTVSTAEPAAYHEPVQEAVGVGAPQAPSGSSNARFWAIVESVAGRTDPNEEILRGGLDSLGLTELFLRIEQELGVESAELSEFLGGTHKWGDLAARVVSESASHVAEAHHRPMVRPPPLAAPVAPSAPESPVNRVADEFFTSPLPRGEQIRTTHVGSLPRPKKASAQLDQLAAILNQQLDIGISVINDGEAGRADYASTVLQRLTGFEEQEETIAPQPEDLQELPCVARKYMVRAGLITLNAKIKTCNPRCVDRIAYHGQSALRSDLRRVKSRLLESNRTHGTFYSAPSPGTLAMFFSFENGYYKTRESYVDALAAALADEYRIIVEEGFILQVDCPDLAMSRHTKFKHLGLHAWKAVIRSHVMALNKALEGIPSEMVRIHLCWGNYSGTHHRDVDMKHVLPIAMQIKADGFGFESANNRHLGNMQILKATDIPKDKYLLPGVVDTCSQSVEHPDVVCQRICEFAHLVGPHRVVANTDCGFSTTAEAQGLPAEVAWMKLRALVAGARKASKLFFPTLPNFLLRSSRRVFYFTADNSDPSTIQVNDDDAEIRVVMTSHIQDIPVTASAIAKHVRKYVDQPVVFLNDGGAKSVRVMDFVKACLADGQERNSPAFPFESLQDLTKSQEVVSLELDTSASTLPEKVDVVVVGAGIVGLLAAERLSDKGLNVVVLEKAGHVGGIWETFANAKSQVNSSEGSYRIHTEYRERANRDHSYTYQVRQDILKLAKRLHQEGRLFTRTEVKSVSKTEESKYLVHLEGTCVSADGVVLAINDRVGIPRNIKWKGQEKFQGKVVNGFGGDADKNNVDWEGKTVIVVGMGAFAVENVRTALEHGAEHVVVVARRHGTICPKFIDYINFVNRFSVAGGGELDTNNNTKNMFLWRKMYEQSNATMPECWLDIIKHPGHTISVSDVWFIAHHLGKMETVVADIDHFVEDGVFLTTGDFVEVDVVVRCTGFERNASLVPKLTGYNEIVPTNYLDTNLMYLADAYIDDEAFNSFFGSSVVEMAKFYVSVYTYFFQNPNEYYKAAKHFDSKKLPVQERKWSHYITGAEYLVETVPGIRKEAEEALRQRYKNFVRTQTPEEYVASNKREWNELHELLSQGECDPSCYLPYPDWKCPESLSQFE